MGLVCAWNMTGTTRTRMMVRSSLSVAVSRYKKGSGLQSWVLVVLSFGIPFGKSPCVSCLVVSCFLLHLFFFPFLFSFRFFSVGFFHVYISLRLFFFYQLNKRGCSEQTNSVALGLM